MRRFGKTGRQKEIDELDFQLAILLLKEYINEQIADTTDNPMSTKYYKTQFSDWACYFKDITGLCKAFKIFEP
ncbi:MAG TPA: hypothetical protein VKA91_09960 [Nitrososphaeraceae archaeon]|nr:hypothetical protein [Nitrososphaeraceae archaeon]